MYNVDSIVDLFLYNFRPNKRKPDWPPSIHNFQKKKVSYSQRSCTDLSPFTRNDIMYITRQVILFHPTGCLEDTLQTLPVFGRLMKITPKSWPKKCPGGFLPSYFRIFKIWICEFRCNPKSGKFDTKAQKIFHITHVAQYFLFLETGKFFRKSFLETFFTSKFSTVLW